MTAAAVLRAVRAAGAEIERIADDRLRLRAAAPLPAELIAAVRTHKPALLTLLRRSSRSALERVADPLAADPSDRIALASILHSDGADPQCRARLDACGGLPREWADGLARLQTRPVPVGLTPAEWAGLIAVAGQLLERWGRALSALGWRTEDLFAVHLTRPLVRSEAVGLVRLLAGREVIAVTVEAATLRCWDGAVQVYRRRPAGRAGWGVLWQLPPVPEADGTVSDHGPSGPSGTAEADRVLRRAAEGHGSPPRIPGTAPARRPATASGS